MCVCVCVCVCKGSHPSNTRFHRSFRIATLLLDAGTQMVLVYLLCWLMMSVAVDAQECARSRNVYSNDRVRGSLEAGECLELSFQDYGRSLYLGVQNTVVQGSPTEFVISSGGNPESRRSHFYCETGSQFWVSCYQNTPFMFVRCSNSSNSGCAYNFQLFNTEQPRSATVDGDVKGTCLSAGCDRPRKLSKENTPTPTVARRDDGPGKLLDNLPGRKGRATRGSALLN